MWTEVALQISGVAVLIYISLALIEIALDLYQRTQHYQLKDTLCSLTMGGFYLGTKLLMKTLTLLIFVWASQHAVFDFSNSWYWFPVVYVIVDFCFYWLHRFIHEVRFGWAAHVNHHSSQQYNLGGTAFRQSFAEPIMEPFFYAPVVLLGFDPLMTLAAIELNLIYMFWLHTRSIGKLHPAFEWLMSTPSHHRVHHGANVQYLDKNYGGTLIVWDRLFSSFCEENETVKFGIPNQLTTFNPIVASIHGWLELARDVIAAKGVKNRLAYLYMPPGWAPDGKSDTTKQQQRRYYQELHAGESSD